MPGILRAPAVIATRPAARTGGLRLGTGVSLIPPPPLRLAEEYAMLGRVSNGSPEYAKVAASSITP